MSFSAMVKDELSRRVPSARHCQLAEISAVLSLCGRVIFDEEEQGRKHTHGRWAQVPHRKGAYRARNGGSSGFAQLRRVKFFMPPD